MNVAPGVWNKQKLESFLNGTGGGICCGPFAWFQWKSMEEYDMICQCINLKQLFNAVPVDMTLQTHRPAVAAQTNYGFDK